MAVDVAQTRRSAASRPTVPPNARALTAAATRLDPTNLREAARIKNLAQDWQRDAWGFYRTLSEIHFGHDYYGNVVSRVRLYPGYQADPDDAPVPLDELGDDDPPETANPESVTAAVDEMRRLDNAADGGLPGVAGDFAVNLALAGEAYLYGKEDPDSPYGETFAVYSTEELKASEAGYAIHRKGESLGKAVGPDDYVLRVWRRLRQYRDLADAPMMALLLDCDNLLQLKQVLLASAQSRRHGGIYKVPSEWSFPQQSTDPNANGQNLDDPLQAQMMEAFTTPLRDPASVASVMPLIVRGPAETLDKATWQDFGRGLGQDILKEIDGARHAVAVGLDLPVEVLEGVGDVNHWGAWQVALDTWKSHIEPLVLVITRALTDGYLRPALEARGLDSTGFVVGYDPSQLVGSEDTFEHAREMHAAFTISDAALRRAGGSPEDDAPDEEEIQRRLYIAQQLRITERISVPTGVDTQQPASELASAPGGNSPPNPADTKPGAPALTAAGRRDPLAQLGPRLTQIDQDLRARIQTLADAALQRALERAGAIATRRIRGGQKGRAGSMKAPDGIRDLALSEVTQALGREHLLSMGLDEDKLIDGELGGLETEYRKLTKRALAAALLAGNRAVPDRDLTDDQMQTLRAGQETWIAGGLAILSAAVLNAAHDQLFTPAQVPSGPGEIDLSARVSPSAIRESLAVAGGASAVDPTAAGVPSGGVATGQIVMDTFRESLSILPAGWQWVYGYPDREFEPHAQLEGQEFSSWEDDVLLNDGDWPDTPYFAPGDHNGCSCSFIAMFESDRPADEAPPEEG